MAFHAGMERHEIVDGLLSLQSGDIQVVVSACGEVPEVRCAHFTRAFNFATPLDFEAYVSQVSLAGRDGLAVTLFDRTEGNWRGAQDLIELLARVNQEAPPGAPRDGKAPGEGRGVGGRPWPIRAPIIY